MKERRITRAVQSDLQSAGFRSDELLAPEQALTLYFSRAQLPARNVESVPIESARERILARTVAADRAYPVAARSAMDGFAVRTRELPGRLRIAGRIEIEASSPELQPGSVLRIPTGGVVPHGADAVVPIESTRVDGDAVWIDSIVAPGDCITPAGSDMRSGETLLEPGTRIGAPQLSVLATLGIAEVDVYRRPRVAVISSGNELVEVRAQPAPSQVRDSNRWALAGALEAKGVAVCHYPIAPDDPQRLHELLRGALEECDAVVLTGGSSVGERDFTPQIVDALGEPGVIVHGLRVRPGKPTVLASAGGKPVIGLPGNPASALLVFEAVGATIVSELTGCKNRPREIAANVAEDYRKRGGWTWFVPIRLEEHAQRCIAFPLEIRSSSSSLLARASGFAILGESVEQVAAGQTIWVRKFD